MYILGWHAVSHVVPLCVSAAVTMGSFRDDRATDFYTENTHLWLGVQYTHPMYLVDCLGPGADGVTPLIEDTKKRGGIG